MAGPRPVCVIVGAGSKYSGNEAFRGDPGSNYADLPEDVRFGIGGGVALAFAGAGYAVCLMSRSMGNLRPMERLLRGKGAAAESIACDVTDAAAVTAAFAECRRRLGGVDVLFYNAGLPPPARGGGRAEHIDPGAFDAAYQIHVAGLLRCAKEVLPVMRERGAGTILVTGNTQCVRGTARFGVTAPSKFAQRGLTQVIAQEYKPHGVHVCMIVVDGTTDAPGIRLGAMGQGPVWEKERRDPGAYMLAPAGIGEAALYLTRQPHSVWTHELWLTPKKVKLGQRL